MSNSIIQVITVIISVVAGGGLVSLLTVRAQKDKIIGEGDVAKANAAKTYHEISMEMIQEAREQVSDMRAQMKDLQTELVRAEEKVAILTRKVGELSDLLDEKDRIIRSQEKELAALRAK
jgi:peptidoglycan hydrolase CwlO-like protein